MYRLKSPLHLDILFVAICANAPVSLFTVLGAQRLGVEIDTLETIARGRITGSVTHRDKLLSRIGNYKYSHARLPFEKTGGIAPPLGTRSRK